VSELNHTGFKEGFVSI